jgi:hypothetical protein
MHRMCFSCRRERFKIYLEVVALDVVASFTVALDDDATILPRVMTNELVTEAGHCDAQWHAWLMR